MKILLSRKNRVIPLFYRQKSIKIHNSYCYIVNHKYVLGNLKKNIFLTSLIVFCANAEKKNND